MKRLILIFLLVICAQAQATTLNTDEDRLAWFLPVARAQWTDSPCVGVENVVLHDDAEVPTGKVGAAFGNCRAGIVSGLDDYTFCAVLVHEMGHLDGQDHSTDPESIMYPTVPGDYMPCLKALPPPDDPITSTPMATASTQPSAPSEIDEVTSWFGKRARSQWISATVFIVVTGNGRHAEHYRCAHYTCVAMWFWREQHRHRRRASPRKAVTRQLDGSV